MRTNLIALFVSLLLVGQALAQQDNSGACQAPTRVGSEAQVCDCPNCGGAACKVCVPEPAKKKNEKTVYSSKCVDFCVKGCPGLLNPTRKDCQGCDTPNCPMCGKVRTKKVLMKKVQTTECDTFKCVPQTVSGDHTTSGACH